MRRKKKKWRNGNEEKVINIGVRKASEEERNGNISCRNEEVMKMA
jgi:hypothetical protein